MENNQNIEIDFSRFNAKDTKSSQARMEFYNSEGYANSTPVYQKVVESLLDATSNQDYILAAAKNINVAKRGDFELVQKIADAKTWLNAEDAQKMSFEQIQQESNNYHFVMRVLTSPQVLEQEKAAQIAGAVLSCETSQQAVDASCEVFTAIVKNNTQNDQNSNSLDAMISEATSSQVHQRENSGMSK